MGRGMGNLQVDPVSQRVEQMVEQNISGYLLRMFVCSNIDEIFEVNIIMDQELKEERKIYWDSLAEKIITNYPRFYRLLCILRINKIYAKIMGR